MGIRNAMSAVLSTPGNPTETARETIRQLVTRRIPPTPENYAQVYAEICGDESVIHPAVQVLHQYGTAAGAAGQALLAAMKARKWDEATTQARRLAGAATAGNPAWHLLLRDLIKQWVLRHDGLAAGRKREAFEHVLDHSKSDPGKLFTRLSALVKSWSEHGLARTSHGKLATLGAIAADPQIPALLRELLAQTLEFAVTDRLGYTPELAGESARAAQLVREATIASDVNRVAHTLKQFWLKLELRGESVDGLLRGLVTLVKLLTQNIGAVSGDKWLRAQMARAEELLREPLDPKALREAEKSFREVAYRQGALKDSLDDAQTALKTMATLLVDRLGQLSESTGGYQQKLGAYAGQIEAADDIAELSAAITGLITDTRGAQADVRRTRDELDSVRRAAQGHEERVRRLEKELDQVGQLVKEDQLTSVLNRRGLEEAFAVEDARSARAGSPLSVALLDIDNFKQLNDQLGHAAGDEALKHLAGILREAVRPSDVVARYGGEEFVLLLPDTGIEEAVAVMTRVQRTLTRKFFLHQNERVLITFSAGVALRAAGESRDDVVGRADGAMYKAKKTGKNRVCVAE